MIFRAVSSQPWWPRRDTWLALLLFTGLALLLAYPISLHPATLRFPTGPDGDLGWYLLGWDAHAFLHKPWAIFDANIYYPERLTLAYGESVIGLAIFAAPIVWLTGNLLLAANVVSLLSPVLCGLAAYVLARRVGLSVAAAIICGIVFECAPPRFFRIGQMNLSNIQWIPFGLAALHAYLATNRPKYLRFAAACFTLQALVSGYAAVFMLVTLLLFAGWHLLLGEPVRLVQRIRDLGFTGVLLLAPVPLVFLPYRAVQREVGLQRGLGTWDPNYSSFIASPSYVHRYLLGLFAGGDVSASSYLFPGYLALALAAVAVAVGVVAVSRRIALSRPVAWRTRATSLAATYRWPVAALIVAAVASTALGAVRPTLPAGTGLRGDYYANGKWSGAPVMSVVDGQPSTTVLMTRWSNQPPRGFSVTWSGYLSILRPGLYFFATTSENRSRLYIDRELVVDNAGGHKNGQAGAVRLDRGAHIVVLEYEQTEAPAAMKWEWIYDGDRDRAYKVVPRWALSERRVSGATVIAARVVEALQPIVQALVMVAAAWVLLALPIRRHEVWTRLLDSFRRNPTGFYLVLTLVFAGLALGPPYGLWRFVYWLPAFNLVRAYSRFGMVALLGLAVLAGIGFDAVARHWRGRRRAIAAVACAAVLVAEYAAMPMASQPSNFEVPPIDRWLGAQSRPFVVAEVPVFDQSDVARFEQQETNYMIHSSAHWQKTVHGYSGWRTDRARQLFAEMQAFPDDTSLGSLEALGVTYVVVHSDLYPPEEWKRVEERIRGYGSRLRFVHAEGAGRVYQLNARSG
jgi:PA14 domain